MVIRFNILIHHLLNLSTRCLNPCCSERGVCRGAWRGAWRVRGGVHGGCAKGCAEGCADFSDINNNQIEITSEHPL